MYPAQCRDTFVQLVACSETASAIKRSSIGIAILKAVDILYRTE